MISALLRILFAGVIALVVVGYLAGGDFGRVGNAIGTAYNAFATALHDTLARKEKRIAEKAASPEDGTTKADAAIGVVTKLSVASPMASELKLTGSTAASRQVEARTETTGMIASTTQKGRRVQEGEILCRLKVGDRAARREASMARYKQAKIEENTQTRLRERGIAAANTASNAQASADIVRAEIKQLDIEIRRLEVRAPFSGVIEGDPAQIGSIMQMGSTCATIVDPDPIRVIGFAPEFRIGDVNIGTIGTAVLATGERVQGSVVFIAQSADPATRTFQVDLSVPNPSYTLRDEVTAEITIPLGNQPAHTLPQSALTLDENGKIGVMIVEDSKATFREVQILRDNSDGLRVSGLGQTAEVILVGQEYVSEGTPVTTTSAADARLDGAS